MDDKQIILYFFVAICLLGQRKVSGKFTVKIYIDALHVCVLKHSLTPCKSNSEVFIFIQFAMNIFYKAIIEPPIFPALPTSFRIVISFV